MGGGVYAATELEVVVGCACGERDAVSWAAAGMWSECESHRRTPPIAQPYRTLLVLFGWVVGGGLRAANPHFSGATLLRFTFQSLSGGLYLALCEGELSLTTTAHCIS